MQFSRRKLPLESASEMRACPVESVKPYALMPAPVYVYLTRNQKFLSVKAPLDFFTPEELERLKAYGNFFMPKFVDQVARFREAGRRVRALLKWDPSTNQPGLDTGRTRMMPASYELSDAVLRIVGPLWAEGCRIEPFFVTVFADELCDLLPSDRLQRARDLDVARFETALFRSSWFVFLALHLGFCNLDFVNRVRERAFLSSFADENPFAGAPELDELYQLASLSIETADTRLLEGAFFDDRPERVGHRIRHRLERVREELIPEVALLATVFGKAGFADG